MNDQMTSNEVAQTVTPGSTSLTPNPTGSEASMRTRSGRIVKKPERYSPVEVCDDDYESNDYDSDISSDVSSEASVDPDDISGGESDADENGNLDGFVVEDKSDESDIESDVSAAESETDA